MNFKPTPAAFYAALILALSAWVLHGFIEAVAAACVIAIASWPLYRAFKARMPRGMPQAARALVFTTLMSVFVLAPLMFAFVALVTEAHGTLIAVAAADQKGLSAPQWLRQVPLAGPWLAARWTHDFAHPGSLSLWMERAGPTAFFAWAQSLGAFAARHVFIVLFTILMLFFLYLEGESVAQRLKRALRERIGDRADRYLDVAARAARAAVNSMLLVGLFDGCATSAAYRIIGVPHALTWGAITGALALVPFLGYIAVAALALQVGMAGAAATATLAFILGCLLLFLGDKVVRPAVARNGTHLPFVWILMGCLGGFEVLGLVGLVIGPVALTLSREILKDLS